MHGAGYPLQIFGQSASLCPYKGPFKNYVILLGGGGRSLKDYKRGGGDTPKDYIGLQRGGWEVWGVQKRNT